MNKSINILSTKTLNNDLLQTFDSTPINIVSTDFISIKPLPFDKNLLKESSKNWVITSKNTLYILFESFSGAELNEINFYCVGDKTKQLILKHNYNLIESALSSMALGELIQQKHKTKSFTIIGGVIKRDELKSLLKDLYINFTDISIYDTIFTPHLLTEKFDGILFFSPSAIQSYIQNNQILDEQLFCIGNTTATEAKQHSNHIHIAKQQTFESVLERVKQYYT